jgi:putative transposase
VCQGNPGYDGGKKIKGRKRHIVVDTLGLILAVVVHSVTPHDSKAAVKVFLL